MLIQILVLAFVSLAVGLIVAELATAPWRLISRTHEMRRAARHRRD